MHVRTYFLGILFGALLMSTFWAATPRLVRADTCYDALGQVVPCPERDKKPTVTPVPPTATWTPTETLTPTATLTPNFTPTTSKTPEKLCLSPEEFKKCLGNPQCQGIPLCPQAKTATPTTPAPLSIPGSPLNAVGLLTLLGGLLGGGYFAARAGLFKRWSAIGHGVNTGDSDNLSDSWEENKWIDLNSDGQLHDGDANTSDPPEDSQPFNPS